MPDVPAELISFLDEQFRYLHKKKRVIKELADTRRWNLAYISALTKFSLLPTHVILHMYKVYVDDFSGVSIDNLAMFLEGCGRFLLRDEATGPRMAAMCNPPERGPRQEKERSQMVLFIRHLIYDVLAKKTIDKVLKLLRKLDWDDSEVQQTLHKVFTRPWKVKYANVSLLALLSYDLQRYHAAFSIGVVDQVLEDIRRGLEVPLHVLGIVVSELTRHSR
ncbi:hypothetical protein FRC00_007518 [Tulasnella sp. 408]|nr:hypothetical protein FRC00_007518 [Tulasnella sp. 408]